jgi:hypothetical protein
MIGRVLLQPFGQSDPCKRNKNKARYLQPELPQNSGKVTEGCSRPARNCAVCTGPLHLLTGNPSSNAELSGCRDVCHLLLDFTNLRV